MFELFFVCLSVSLCVMCLALCDVLVGLKMNFTVYWVICKSRINNTFDRSIAGVQQVDNRGTFETVVKSICVHHSQKIFVHYMRPLNLVFAIESSVHCIIHEITVRVNCESIIFKRRCRLDCSGTIIFIFNSEYLYSFS